MARRGRPVGYRPSEEARRKASQSQKENWRQWRFPWLEATTAMLDAIEQDDPEGAHAILQEFIDKREEEGNAAARSVS